LLCRWLCSWLQSQLRSWLHSWCCWIRSTTDRMSDKFRSLCRPLSSPLALCSGSCTVRRADVISPQPFVTVLLFPVHPQSLAAARGKAARCKATCRRGQIFITKNNASTCPSSCAPQPRALLAATQCNALLFDELHLCAVAPADMSWWLHVSVFSNPFSIYTLLITKTCVETARTASSRGSRGRGDR
jgi:hypothetical protein